jgi:hypothetical protein
MDVSMSHTWTRNSKPLYTFDLSHMDTQTEVGDGCSVVGGTPLEIQVLK